VRAVAIYSELCGVHNDAYVHEHASAMNTLSIRLSEHGQLDDACRIARINCGLLHPLAEKHPEQWWNQYTAALRTYSNRLADSEQSAAAIEEANRLVLFCRQLCDLDPVRQSFSNELAGALLLLADRQRQCGFFSEADASVQEAQRIVGAD